MRRAVSLCLALALCLGLMTPVLAVEAATPTPPEWVNTEDYLIFPGDEVYQPENWAKVETLREEARNGATNVNNELARSLLDTVGGNFEVGLVALRCAENLEERWDQMKGPLDSAYYDFRRALSLWEKGNGGVEDETWKGLRRWFICASFLHGCSVSVLDDSLKELNLALDEFFELPFMHLASQGEKKGTQERLAEYRARVALQLDGYAILREGDGEPEVRNDRIMVPLRAIAETLGADVEWVQEEQKVIMTRAGSTVTMILDSAVADVDGRKIALDAPCYAKGNRTLVPVRFVAEAFGQSVVWNEEDRTAYITEDKTVAGDSNLEAWALPMGAMLNYMNRRGAPLIFGESSRCTIYEQESGAEVRMYQEHRENLAKGWNIHSREDLVNTVVSMTMGGHNATFREMAADVKLRTPEEREAISAQAPDTWPAYMWEYTEYLDQKWGDRGIMAWDLFRMSNLVQWGYTAGYVTYAEALELLEPAATILCENFSSWDEAYENYLDGYSWWARKDVLGEDIWLTERGQVYKKMLQDKKVASVFNNTLFEIGVISLPQGKG